MNNECKLTLSPETLRNTDSKAKSKGDQNRQLEMTQTASESHIDVSKRERTEAHKDGGQRYRFDRLTLPLALRDLHFNKDDPGPGDRVPEFDLPILDGGRFRSSDLAKSRPTLLIFGSSTCPVTDNASPGLNELYLGFGHRVRFVMVNVREAHPGKSFPQPRTPDAKMAHAEQLRHLHGLQGR